MEAVSDVQFLAVGVHVVRDGKRRHGPCSQMRRASSTFFLWTDRVM